MHTEDIQTLFAYNTWANERILATAEGLTEAEYVAVVPGISHGSIRATLVHALAAESIWRQRCLAGVSPTMLLREADLPAFDALRVRWTEEAQAWRDGLAGLTDVALHAPVDYRTTRGTPMRDTLWSLLAHVVNHGTQHRAETAVALTAFGRSPGDVDLIVYLRQTQAATDAQGYYPRR